MNFFERQRQVRRVSARLVLLFIVAVVGIVTAIDLAVIFAFDGLSMDPGALAGLLVTATLLTVSAIALAAAFRMVGLRGGGGTVARELGGVLVPADTTDPQLRRLRNVVEEIAIASGVPVPEVYVLPQEDAINAFAAGWSTSDAAIAVTRGALERLNRAELQGVIAHEFSHVVNGDMRLNIRLMGLLFGILFLSIIGRTLVHTGVISGGRGRGDRSGGNPVAVVGLALLAAGFIGVLAGRLIKAAVSRQREYLADASAVQFTRQPSGLVGALTKIAGLEAGSKLHSPKSEEVGHMLFGSGARLSSLMATHPPLIERIRVLDPTFDPARLRDLAQRWAVEPPSGLAEDVALGFAPAPPATDLPAAGSTVPIAESAIVGRIATAPPDAYLKASAMIEQIPADVLARVRRVDTVAPVMLGLLMAEDLPTRTAQHAALAERHGKEVADTVWTEANALAELHPLLRLPLAELAFPALRQLTADARGAVVEQIFGLIRTDGEISAYEYCLSRLVYSELVESMHPHRSGRTGRRHLTDTAAEAAMLLSVVAAAGNADPSAARHAFAAGMQRALPGMRAPYAPPESYTALEAAWPALMQLAPADTEGLVAAVVAAISHDGVTTRTELELLRTICGLLHCPVPL